MKGTTGLAYLLGIEGLGLAAVALALSMPQAARAEGVWVYDAASRTLHLGAAPPPASPDIAAQVVFGRAVDIVGTPLRPVPRPDLSSIALGRGDFAMPVGASGVTSRFGNRRHPILGGERFHAGLDLGARFGAPIEASSDGIAGGAGWAGGYGLLVSLEHGAGIETRYGHMSRLSVRPGQRVRKGDVIGYVGSTGRSTGPHLHYEVRVNGRAVDPARLLRR